MFKLIFSLVAFIAVASQVQAIQIIHRPNAYRNAQETHELNQQEERQEMMRQQLKMQEEELRIQRQMLQIQQQQQQQQQQKLWQPVRPRPY